MHRPVAEIWAMDPRDLATVIDELNDQARKSRKGR